MDRPDKSPSRLKSFVFAFAGLRQVFSTEKNLRIHLAAALVAVAAGFYFQLTPSEWLFLCTFIILVIVTEVLNTCIELIVDLVSPQYHPAAGKIKDIAAAAVLLAATGAVFGGLIIFLPKILHFVQNS